MKPWVMNKSIVAEESRMYFTLISGLVIKQWDILKIIFTEAMNIYWTPTRYQELFLVQACWNHGACDSLPTEPDVNVNFPLICHLADPYQVSNSLTKLPFFVKMAPCFMRLRLFVKSCTKVFAVPQQESITENQSCLSVMYQGTDCQ